MFLLIAAAAAEAAKNSGGLDFTDLAALVTAIGGVIAGIIAARKGAKADKVKEEQQEQGTILEGYGQIVKDLQHEVDRIRKMYIEDEVRWRTERTVLLEQIKLYQAAEILDDPPPTRRRRRTKAAEEDPT